ncbi:MAG: PP2C family protein-serine/threonine phosphatase [Ktedonobacterales bacterium]
MSLRLIAASKTDVGRMREQNEDSFYVHMVESDQASGLFVVADGMGGYHAGEVASKIAVDTISAELESVLRPTSAQPTVRLKGKRGRGQDNRAKQGAEEERDAEDPGKTRPLNADEKEAVEVASEQADAPSATQHLNESVVIEHYAEKLRSSVEQSSEAIVAYGRQHPEAAGLGSTMTGALIIGERAFIANVGDSRTYLLRDGKLERITTDHSLVERLVEAGQIDRTEVYDHPNRNLIYRSLGAGKAEVDVDIFAEKLLPGDQVLLCSDGLWDMVRDGQIESILNEVSDPVEACDLLVQRANENGGEDNITVILVRCVEG